MAGHSSLLSQEASSTLKDRANTPRRMLEGRGNADENEKKYYETRSSLFPIYRKKIPSQTWATEYVYKEGKVSTA